MTPEERKIASCESCVYWADKESLSGNGECRINPPRTVVIDADNYQDWPSVREDDFCGRWESA